MQPQSHDNIRAVIWQDDALSLLDQRVLPLESTYLRLDNVHDTAQAITDMVVRGAPAIGIAAAFGVVLAARDRYAESPSDWRAALAQDLEHLGNARPTAINLLWAIQRMQKVIDQQPGNPVPALLAEAQAIHEEDIAANYRMGELGAALIGEASGILTHCNTGSLATGGYGTALGVVRSAWKAGKAKEIFADETRPWLQGSRLTAWELVQDDIPVQVIADGAAAWLMRQGKVDWVIVGSDRIVANGDVANKIGTYSTAVLARHHGARFMVVAPSSTVDMQVERGEDIPIETRTEEEVLCCGPRRVGAEGAGAWNPVFDVTPAELIDAIVTEKGVVERPDKEKMAAMMAG